MTDAAIQHEKELRALKLMIDLVARYPGDHSTAKLYLKVSKQQREER